MKSIYELREVGSVRSAVDAKNLETLYAPADVAPREQPAFGNGTLVAGKYQVESLIAEGGMGVVVLAKHVALQQRVAIKYLKANALGNQDAVDRFLREARLAARLTSEHVVRVQDVGSLPVGGPYMVMEYLVGESLGQVVERGPLPVAEAVDYILQACDALAEAHALKIVHRDIKPDNLFLARRSSNTPIIKVIDFGISKIGGGSRHDGDDASRDAIQKTATNERFGTPLYMSPEQLRSTADVDMRTDVWSIGVVLHELLTGLLPFPGTDIPQLCTSILTTAPRRLSAQRPGAPLVLEGILLRCLEKDPAARYRNVGELAQELLPFGPASASGRVARIQAVVRDGGHSIRPPTPLHLPLMTPAGGRPATMMASEMGLEEPTDAAIHDMMRGGTRRKRRVGVAGMAALGVCTALGVYVAFAGEAASPGNAAGVQPESPAVTAASAPGPALGSALLPALHPSASAQAAPAAAGGANAPKRAKALPLRAPGTANGGAPASGDAAKRRAMFGERE